MTSGTRMSFSDDVPVRSKAERERDELKAKLHRLMIYVSEEKGVASMRFLCDLIDYDPQLMQEELAKWLEQGGD